MNSFWLLSLCFKLLTGNCLYIYPTISPPAHLPHGCPPAHPLSQRLACPIVRLFIHVIIRPFICLFVWSSVCPSVHPSAIHHSFACFPSLTLPLAHLPIHPSDRHSAHHPSIWSFLCPSVCPTIRLSVCPPLHPSAHSSLSIIYSPIKWWSKSVDFEHPLHVCNRLTH